jgi:hypothetical protein
MAKIPIDTIQFRKSFRYFLNQIDLIGKPTKEDFLKRVEEIEKRIGETTDEIQLQTLDSTKKHYLKVANLIDIQESAIKYFTDSFNDLDESYWNTIINGAKLQEEIVFLKDTIENLQKQRDMCVDAWKSERAKWNRERIIKMKIA